MANRKPVINGQAKTNKKRAGNPNWGKSYLADPVIVNPSMFELAADQLRLKPNQYAHSEELQRWGRKNYTRYYVPQDLLEKWGLSDCD